MAPVSFRLQLVILTVAYFVAAWVGLQLAIPPGNATLFWPASGIALAALLLGGLRLWPAIAIGAFAVTLLTSAPPLAAAMIATGNTLSAVVAVALLRRTAFDDSLPRLRDVWLLVIFGAGVGTAVSAAIGAGALYVLDGIRPVQLFITWATWWVGDALGALFVAPFILVWRAPFLPRRRHWLIELCTVMAFAAVLNVLTFRYLTTSLYLTFLPLLWAAVRLDLRGATSLALLGWVIGQAHVILDMTAREGMGSLSLETTQLFLAIFGLVGLVTAGAVSERDRTRRELRWRSEWTRTMLAQASDVLAVIDERGVIEYITDSVRRFFAGSPHQLLDSVITDQVHPDDIDAAEAALAEVSETPGSTVTIRARIRHSDGDWRVVEAVARNALDNPSVEGIILCVRDVTRQAENERALSDAHATAVEAARLRSEFLANVSHELRTPLNVVFGLTEMLLDSPLDADQVTNARGVQDSTRDLLRLIDDILDLAKIDSGRIEIVRREIQLNRILHDTMRALRIRAVGKPIDIHAEVDDALADVLWGDPDRIRQVLINYLSNAIKFTHEGSIHVSAKAVGERDGAVHARIEVSDTGIGIPHDRMHRLFLPFSQVDGSMARKFGGTGLGLAISKQLTEAMGGEVGVESQLHEGSTFWFSVPLGKTKTESDRETSTDVPVLFRPAP